MDSANYGTGTQFMCHPLCFALPTWREPDLGHAHPSSSVGRVCGCFFPPLCFDSHFRLPGASSGLTWPHILLRTLPLPLCVPSSDPPRPSVLLTPGLTPRNQMLMFQIHVDPHRHCVMTAFACWVRSLRTRLTVVFRSPPCWGVVDIW